MKEIEKNDVEHIRIAWSEFKGRRYLDCRVHFQDAETGDWRPTRKGLTLDPEIWAEVLEALRAELNG